MIGTLVRLLPILVSAVAARERRLVSRLRRRVGLGQIDVNLHMNQARYADVFEWGRLDLLLRSGAMQAWRRRGIHGVVAEQQIVYRRELKPFVRYQIDSRATGMDGRLLVVEHHLVVGDRVHARGVVKLIFIGSDGVLSAEAAAAQCEAIVTEPLPVHDWRV